MIGSEPKCQVLTVQTPVPPQLAQSHLSVDLKVSDALFIGVRGPLDTPRPQRLGHPCLGGAVANRTQEVATAGNGAGNAGAPSPTVPSGQLRKIRRIVPRRSCGRERRRAQ
jgi:hypothetical protein